MNHECLCYVLANLTAQKNPLFYIFFNLKTIYMASSLVSTIWDGVLGLVFDSYHWHGKKQSNETLAVKLFHGRIQNFGYFSYNDRGMNLIKWDQ